MAMKGGGGGGREQQGLKTLDTLPWGLTWLWVWTCWIWGAKGLRARAQERYLQEPSGAQQPWARSQWELQSSAARD